MEHQHSPVAASSVEQVHRVTVRVAAWASSCLDRLAVAAQQGSHDPAEASSFEAEQRLFPPEDASSSEAVQLPFLQALDEDEYRKVSKCLPWSPAAVAAQTASSVETAASASAAAEEASAEDDHH
jgi:hypothetical protein